MAPAAGADPGPWQELLAKAVHHLEHDLFKRGRFIQQVMRATPRTGDAAMQKSSGNRNYSPEAMALMDAEGPKYQYGNGVLSDGVIGAWMAEATGLGSPLNASKVRSHLAQIHRHNLRHDLRDHACPQRPGYANGAEGGLLLCTWPDGGKPTLPFIYSDEVWTGIEYQVASHCIMAGLADEDLEIVRLARVRYDGGVPNPFDEYATGTPAPWRPGRCCRPSPGCATRRSNGPCGSRQPPRSGRSAPTSAPAAASAPSPCAPMRWACLWPPAAWRSTRWWSTAASTRGGCAPRPARR